MKLEVKIHKEARVRHPVVRFVLVWIIQTIALVIMAWWMDSVSIGDGRAFLIAGVLGIVNALLWPLLSYVLLPSAVLTLGIGALFMNALVVMVTAWISPNLMVEDFGSAFWLALGMAAVNVILSSLLTIDDDNSWYRNQVKRRMKRVAKPNSSKVPGLFFLEIDGLSKPVLEKALALGYMPTLRRWLDKTHTLTGWETDTSSQTSASQAGLLHGDNRNIPAFRWYDKKSKRIVASSNPKLLPAIEKERSDGKGLLAQDGASRGNMFSGDAQYVLATASTLRDRSRFHTSEFQAYFANPYNMSRTLMLFFWDMILEKWQYRKAKKTEGYLVLDKHHRGGMYPLIRAAMTVVMRELNIYTLLGDLFAGRSTAYATFVGYDEIAHHSGVWDPGVFDILYKLDQQFARLERAAVDSPRPYEFVVLSDHGQTPGATFLQRYGKTLDELVKELMKGEKQVVAYSTGDEGAQHLSVYLTDLVANDNGMTQQIVKKTFKKQTKAEIVQVGDFGDEGERVQSHPEVYVLASGNLGLISFTTISARATMEEIEIRHPGLLEGLVRHEGIGFVMVRSAKKGTVVLGKNGLVELKSGKVIGTDPLEEYGVHARRHLARTDSFANCPDILVNSMIDTKGEGCAFEELIGFHGGLGGLQTQPFVIHPKKMTIDGELVGAGAVYAQMKQWQSELTQSQVNEKLA